MANGEVKIVILAQDQASKTIQGIGDKMQASLNKVSAVAAVAGAGLAAFAGKAISDFAEAEAAQKQLEHATLDVAHGTREQLKALQDLSTELEHKGVLDGDSIATGLAQLETFGLSSDMVQKLGGSLADLAVNQYGVNASGEQLTQSANMIAKALNGQFGVLEKSGIRFTEAQKALIQYGTESQKASALQEGFAQNLKYTNEVAKQTTEGGIAALKVQMGNISEAIGAALVPSLIQLTQQIQPVIEKIADWSSKNPELISKIFMVVGAVLAIIAIVAPLASAIGTVVTVFTMFTTFVGTVAVPAFGALSVAIGIPMIPLLLIIAAVGVLIAAIVWMVANWTTVGPKVQAVWDVILTTVTTFAASVGAKIMEFGAAVVAWFKAMWEGAKAAFQTGVFFVLGVLDFLTTSILGVSLPTLVAGFTMAWHIFVDTVIALTKSMGDAIMIVWDGIKMAASGLFTAIMATFNFFAKPIGDLWNGIWSALVAVFNGVVDNIKSPIQGLFDWITGMFGKVMDIVKSIGSAIGSAVSSIGKATVARGAGVASKISGARASGGPVSSGSAYLVGENGPEIFSPYGAGTIIPNGKSSGGIGGINVNVNVGKVSSDVDVSRMARVVGEEIMRTLKQNQLIGA